MSTALAGLIMLIIGDSHIAAFGHFNNPLHEGLVSQGAVVNTFGVCASVPGDWLTPRPIMCGRGERHNGDPAQIGTDDKLHGWALPALLAQYHPNVVVLEFGDTLGAYDGADLPRQWVGEQVGEILKPVKSAHLPCIWIGPTWGTEGSRYKKTYVRVKALSDYLSQVVAPCRYIDSLAFARPGEWATTDGVHLTADATRAWDAHLIQSIDEIAATLPRR